MGQRIKLMFKYYDHLAHHLYKSLFGRAPAGASAPAPAGAVPNACFGKGSAWGAGAIFCLRRRSLKNELRVAPCYGFTSSSAKEPFCQTFSRTASAPPEELLIQRSQSRSHFQRSQSPAKLALNSHPCQLSRRRAGAPMFNIRINLFLCSQKNLLQWS